MTITATARHIEIIGTFRHIRNLENERRVGIVQPFAVSTGHVTIAGFERTEFCITEREGGGTACLEGQFTVFRHHHLKPICIIIIDILIEVMTQMGILQHTILERSGRLPSVIQLQFAVHHHRRETRREMVDAIAATSGQIEVVSTCRHLGNLEDERRVGMVEPLAVAALHVSAFGIEGTEFSVTDSKRGCAPQLEGEFAIFRHLNLEPIDIIDVGIAIGIAQVTIHRHSVLQQWAIVPSGIRRGVGLVVGGREGVVKPKSSTHLIVPNASMRQHLVSAWLEVRAGKGTVITIHPSESPSVILPIYYGVDREVFTRGVP